jgi:glycogen synthase
MTPFYPLIIDQSRVQTIGKSIEVDYGGQSVPVEILEYTLNYSTPAKGSLKEYYLRAPGFFNARNDNPYFYDDDQERNNDAIRENALFFCKAVPAAAAALGLTENIVFHLQEWQTALIALTAREAVLNGPLVSCGTVQTLHNSFDSGISTAMLEKIADPGRIRQAGTTPGFFDQFYDRGPTVCQVGLQLVDGPVSTVSEGYARELTADPLQTGYYAPHLQDIFKKNGVYGINNGLFKDFPAEFSRDSEEPLSLAEIEKIKLEKRKELLAVLSGYHPVERFGLLSYQGNDITSLPEDVPVFVMSGRLDPNQKGFDILLLALEKFAGDEIKAVVVPIPAPNTSMDCFHWAADRCAGNLSIFPLRLKKGYKELQMGATYGIMPSIYEPFGAAVEYMVNGAVTIARATGGLKDQIRHLHNGLLYEESPGWRTRENIDAFMRSDADAYARRANPWVREMANALYEQMRQAADIYRNHRGQYYKMVLEGFKHARRFGWASSANKYIKTYRQINKEIV